jgi:heptosyltransferase-2
MFMSATPLSENKIKKRILIIKIGAIGDVALSTALASVYQHHLITWVVGKKSAPLIKAIPFIKRIIEVDETALLEGNLFEKIKQSLFVIFSIFFHYFDEAIIAHKDPRYKLLSLFTFSKKTFSFKRNDPFPDGSLFHSQIYLNLISSTLPIKYPKLNLPSIHPLISKTSTPFIVLNFSSTLDMQKAKRRWPLSYYVSLAKRLKNHVNVVIIGEKRSEKESEEFSFSGIINLVGKTSILEVIALCERSIGMITHDGGPLHLARLSGCKILSLFGPTNPRSFSLDDPREIHLHPSSEKVKCSPCYSENKYGRCHIPLCMKLISPSKAFETIYDAWNLNLYENSSSS